MRSPLVFATSFVLLVAACGGQTLGGPDGGTGSGGGSGSGGSSGSSGGASECVPLAGCSSPSECPAGDGCNTCTCDNGGWSCTELGCPNDGGPITQDSGPSGVCPSSPPLLGTYCPDNGTGCNWASGKGCRATCDCVNNLWVCDTGLCPSCPPSPPPVGSACSVGAICGYPVADVCSTYTCDCYPSGTWECAEESLCPDDAGPTDAGPFDGGFVVDAGNPACPPTEPAESSSCPDDGAVCSYNSCPTNCLCSNGAWVCAKQVGCP